MLSYQPITAFNRPNTTNTSPQTIMEVITETIINPVENSPNGLAASLLIMMMGNIKIVPKNGSI